MDAITAGNVLRDLREARHVSLSELARLAGCSKSSLSKYELNQKATPIEVLARLAAALKVREEVVVLRSIRLRYTALNKGKIAEVFDELITCVEDGVR